MTNQSPDADEIVQDLPLNTEAIQICVFVGNLMSDKDQKEQGPFVIKIWTFHQYYAIINRL